MSARIVARSRDRKRLGMNASVDFRQGIFQHWEKYKALGQPMPACVVIGCPPVISYAAGYKIPDNLDEVAVAGALVGTPINVVRARTGRPADPRLRPNMSSRALSVPNSSNRKARSENPTGMSTCKNTTPSWRGDSHHPPEDPSFPVHHQPGGAERIEHDPARGHGAGIAAIS